MIPATINRVYNLSMDKHCFVLSLLQSIFDSSLGVVTCIIFLLSPEIKHSLIVCWKKLKSVGFFSRDSSYSNSNETNESFIENNITTNDNPSNDVDLSKRTSHI